MGWRQLLIAISLIVVLLTGCGVLSSGPGPWVEGLEERNPVLTDLELERGSRIDVSRRDPHQGLSSYHTPGLHVQLFVPNGGESLASVKDEILVLAEAEGWVMLDNHDLGLTYTGEREILLPDGSSRRDRLTVDIDESSVTGIEPHVSVSFTTSYDPTG